MINNVKHIEDKKRALYHDAQWQIVNDDTPRKVLCCGRRFGKSFLAIMKALAVAKNKPNSTSWIVAPTFSDVTEIYLTDMILVMENTLGWKRKFRPTDKGDFYYNKRNYCFEFSNNSLIFLKSSDKQERLRGRSVALIILDEFAIFTDKNKWESVFVPALATDGELLIISTPKGYDKFYELYIRGQKDTTGTWKSWHFTSYENTKVPGMKEKIDTDRKTMSRNEFAQEYLAEFTSSAGKVTQGFNRNNNVLTLPSSYINGKQIRLGVDFNYNPHCWVAFQILDKETFTSIFPDKSHLKLQPEIILYIKEWKREEYYTSNMIGEVKQWLNSISYSGDLTWYGDATGNANKTSSDMGSDWIQIENAFPLSYIDLPSKNPEHIDRINATNAKIRNTNDEIGLFISDDCEFIIQDFEQVVFKAGSMQIDKRKEKSIDGIGHFYDAATYPVYSEFQITDTWALDELLNNVNKDIKQTNPNSIYISSSTFKPVS
ncbi:MAG: terminase family protein [Ignavibacteriae bacterium]|nr:terminase family protein [Ignavibacteriota bacterium]